MNSHRTTLPRLLTAVLLLAASARMPATASAQPDPSPYYGPENGTLVIVGGGSLSDVIYERFIELAGGPSAPIVTVPTAEGSASYDDDAASAGAFRRLGATNVTVLHTYDPAVADTEAFVAPLRAARGLWFGGGRQWRLVDAYAGTRAEAAFRAVLDERGGVVGGSSAGASILASFLVRGDTASNQVLVGDHTVGFGYLRAAAVDQHVLARNRHFDLLDVLRARPELRLGVALDEDTALVVARNDAYVLGASYAVLYDGGFWSREGSDQKNLPEPDARFYFLRDGDRYDLGERKVVV
ncbi:class I glutamine amidotransferase-like protein [Biscogniauxia sp. FL1348]|nr:class I glutamine amidotransferase-like protein [Biscogniauxia sp. FL1348]